MSDLNSLVAKHWKLLIFTTAVVALVVAAVGACALNGALSEPDKPNNETHTYTEHNGTITEDITDIDFLMLDETTGVGDTTNNEKRGAETAEHKQTYTKSIGNPDIAAQRGMWKAANALVWLTFGQIFIGVFTIGLVGATFWVQKRELDITKQASAAELRPYLEITIGSPQIHWVEKGGYFQLYFWADITNKGKTPARHFTGFEAIAGTLTVFKKKPSRGEEFRITKFGWPEHWKKTLRPRYIAPNQEATRQFAVKILTTNELEKAALHDFHDPNADIRQFICTIKGTVRFKDEFTMAANRHHAITFMIIADANPTRVIIHSESTLPDEDHYDGYEEAT